VQGGTVAATRAAAKVMFEIYREGGYNRAYRVVYFTELNDHNRETEFNRALAGEHVYDGFIRDDARKDAKAVVREILGRLNDGEDLTAAEIERSLAPYLA
jgi:hypothetical protein